MASRTVSVRLKAEINAFKADMASAGKAASDAAARTETSWDGAHGTIGKLGRQIQQHDKAWGAAGKTLVTVGGAITGVGVAALKTGIQYNQLQQTSRAAMTTLMGGAKDANIQMDKLDRFAKTSPFAKQTFIQAQQQMIGFGIESKKVIPYLNSIQDAVAATGGSNAEIAALSESMSKIHATGKITAQDLNELGNRGVDAASLIGESMGKTGEQIRADISSGALDADKALDALADGMEKKFEGAAANVKQTFAGAMDRVKSAWRDLSASLAEPLVGKNGGGLATSGLNKLADSMRGFEKMPGYFKATTVAIGGTVGSVALLSGSFMLLAPRIQSTALAMAELKAAGGKLGAVAGAAGKLMKAFTAIGIAAIAIEGLNFGITKLGVESKANLKGVSRELSSIGDAGAKSSEGMTEGFESLSKFGKNFNKIAFSKDVEDITNLGDALDYMARKGGSWWEPIAEGITPLKQSMQQAKAGIKEYDKKFSELVDSGKLEDAQVKFALVAKGFKDQGHNVNDLVAQFPEYFDSIKTLSKEAGLGADKQTLMKVATGKVTPAMLEQAKAAGGDATAINTIKTKSVEAAKAQEQFEKQVRKTTGSFVDWSSGLKDGKAGLQSYFKDLEKQIKAQGEWVSNLHKLEKRGLSQEAIEQLRALGPKGARIVKELADGTQKDIDRMNGLWDKNAEHVKSAVMTGKEYDKWLKKKRVAKLEADEKPLKRKIKDGEDRLKKLHKKKTTPKVKAEIKDLEDKVRKAKKKLDQIEDKRIRIEGEIHWTSTGERIPLMSKRRRKEYFDEGKGVLSPEEKRRRAAQKKNLGFAVGGPVSGPGTGTSDDIIARLSNGENVWDAKAVKGAGGMANVERLRLLAQQGKLPAFANGGAVSGAQKSVDTARRALERAKRAKAHASKKEKEAADKRVTEAREELDNAKQTLSNLREMQRELRKDVRRGDIRDQVTSGLSGGYSVVDRLDDMSRNKDLSKGRRSMAGNAASKYEKTLRRLWGTQEKLEKSQERAEKNVEKANKALDKANDKLSKAKSHLDDMKSVQKGVSDSLLGDRKVDFGDYSRFEGGDWKSDSGVKGATRRLNVNVGKMKAFAGKMNQLQKAGLPLEILQEIASAGIDEGTGLANAFLEASKADQKSYIGAWKDYEKYSMKAGKYATNAAAPGGLDKAQADVAAAKSEVQAKKIGVATAEGIVKGLKSQEKAIAKQIAKIGRTMEKTLKKVLGIHSPSRVMEEIGDMSGMGLNRGLMAWLEQVKATSALLAQGVVPNVDQSALGAAASPSFPTFQAMPKTVDMSSQSPDATTPGSVSGAVAGTAQAPEEGAWQPITDEASKAVQEAEAVIQAAYAAMDQTTIASLENRGARTLKDMSGMKANTASAMDAMSAKVKDSMTKMASQSSSSLSSMKSDSAKKHEDIRVTSRDKLESMRETSRNKLESMRSISRDKHESMRATSKDKHESMRATSKEKFESMRSTASEKSASMRDQVSSHTESMKDRVADKTSTMRSKSNNAFDSMERHGKSAAKGLRQGASAQIGKMPHQAGGHLNDVLAIFRKFAKAINKSFGEVGVKLSAPKPMSFATGGTLPGHTPGRDIYNFRDQFGRQLNLGGGESVMTTKFTDAVGEDWVRNANKAAEIGGQRGVMNFMSRGGERFDDIGHFKKGGKLRNLDKAKRFAASQDGKPYVWGGAGPGGADCSGFQSEIINVLLGRHPYHRLFATGSAGGAHWGPLVKGKGTYTAGVYHGHTSGTLDGVNVESTTGHGGGRTGIKYGHGARSAVDPMFKWHYKLPEDKGMFVPGDDSAQAVVIPKFLTDAGIKSLPSNMKKAFRKASRFHLAKARKAVAGDIARLPQFHQDLTNATLDKAGKGITKKAVAYSKNMDFGGGGKADGNKEHWRSIVAQALKMSHIGSGKADEDLWLKQIMTESSGNPRLVQSSALKDINVLRGDPARGLVQVPGVTWKDFGKGMGPFIPNVYNPLKNLIVGMRAAWAQHGHGNWRSVIGKGHGYKDGTESATPGWAMVGEEGPELLKLRGGEEIKTHQETRSIIPNSQIQKAASAGPVIDYDKLAGVLANQLAAHPQIVQNVDSTKLTTREVAREAVQRLHDQQNLYLSTL